MEDVVEFIEKQIAETKERLLNLQETLRTAKGQKNDKPQYNSSNRAGKKGKSNSKPGVTKQKVTDFAKGREFFSAVELARELHLNPSHVANILRENVRSNEPIVEASESAADGRVFLYRSLIYENKQNQETEEEAAPRATAGSTA